jgi:superfamily I DNA/RNA helicase
LVSLAKANGLVSSGFKKEGLLSDTPENWSYLISEYSLDFGSPQMSWVFVDEAQDMSAIQRSLLAKLMSEHTRLIAVGDERQVLYVFRGASSDSLKRIKDTFNCKVLPLSISYRCGKSIIREAQKIVPQILSAKNAIEGIVEERGIVHTSEFKMGDFIICRANAPLIKMAYKLLSAKIPASIIGRDVAEELINLIKKMKTDNIKSLQTKLLAWREKEIAKVLKKDPHANITNIDDKYVCIFVAIEVYKPLNTNSLILAIGNLFFDGGGKENCVTLSTIHKIKGMEADRVWFADVYYLPSSRAIKPEDIKIEYNIKYVGITRARKHLIYFNSESLH